jgi:hypothetical protein
VPCERLSVCTVEKEKQNAKKMFEDETAAEKTLSTANV